MTSSEPPSKLPRQPSTLEAQAFDYASLDTETRIVVQQRTSEIKERLRDAAQVIWEIGQKLVDVRSRLEYGQFNSWLKAEFQWSRSTAYNYINVFESFGSCPKFGQLEIATSALYLLAAPSTPEEARQEALERATQGEAITPTSAKTIVTRYKESAKPKATKPVTVDAPAETVERESSTFAEPEAASHTKSSGSPLDEPAAVVEALSSAEIVKDDPASADQSEQKLLGKEVETI